MHLKWSTARLFSLDTFVRIFFEIELYYYTTDIIDYKVC